MYCFNYSSIILPSYANENLEDKTNIDSDIWLNFHGNANISKLEKRLATKVSQ